MGNGNICIETEGQITKKGSRLNLNSEPLVKFISEMNGIPFIYRRVAARSELQYYLNQFSKKEYACKYDMLYFSFHGQTHSIHLEGEKEDISLEGLIDIGGSVFENRFVHFSSCRTLLGSTAVAQSFKDKTGLFINMYSSHIYLFKCVEYENTYLIFTSSKGKSLLLKNSVLISQSIFQEMNG